MKGVFRIGTIAMVSAVILASCAKQRHESDETIEQRTLDSWIVANVNNGTGQPEAVRYGSGLYVQLLEPKPSANLIEAGNWMKINYTGMTLDGNIFKTNDEQTAHEEGTYTIKTRYTPQYMVHNFYNGLTDAEIAAVSIMRRGEKVRVYAPSRMAYAGSAVQFTNGYGGHYFLTAARIPVIFDIELTEIVPDPSMLEKELVNYNTGYVGFTENEEIDDGLYAKVLTSAGTSLVENNSCYFYYVARFVEDRTIFSTNIDSISQRIWNDHTPTNSVVYYKPNDSSSDNELVDILDYAFDKVFESIDIPRPSKVKIFFTSDYGYGSAGNTGLGLTEPYVEVPGYTPLEFDIYIQREEFNPSDSIPQNRIPDTFYGDL